MKIILKGFVLILALVVILSLAIFAQPIQTPMPTKQTMNTDINTEIKGPNPGLVIDIGKASMGFMEDITQNINISKEEFGDKRAIDDLIITMKITLKFTSKVMDIIQNKDTKTELGINMTANKTNLIENEKIEEAFQYLRFLQCEDPCKEAINMMEENRTIYQK